MTDLSLRSDHSFHVPVMGIGFTIDTPIRLAPLGIDSSISLVNDSVIEAARAHHSRLHLLPYTPIADKDPDARARRITLYLDLVDKLVAREIARLKKSSFQDKDGIRRYFELLPTNSPKRVEYQRVQALPEGPLKTEAEDALREQMVPGTIGVNIMTKLDGSKDEKGQPRAAGDSDAQAALRGFALSTVSGPLILSAGANPGLFAYMAEFDDFFPDAQGKTRKPLVLKVSDFRSAHVQGRMLSRRGIWVAEYRIESGLNCGGHAFPTEGLLMGPILQEFKERREELEGGLFKSFHKGLKAKNIEAPAQDPGIRITAQGGIGTSLEDDFLMKRFGLDGTGWGSPFLMVAEAVTMDARTLEALVKVKKEDVELTWSSPLGVRFWWLKTCGSEVSRVQHIEDGRSGSVCTGRHLALNEEFGKVPLCTGSRAYQRKKKAELDPADPEYQMKKERLETPACICVDLCGSFLEATGEKHAPPPAICPGPNIVNFGSERSLEEMVDHIYGRANILTRTDRPHVLLREIELYLQVFAEDHKVLETSLETRNADQLSKALEQLTLGLEFSGKLVTDLVDFEREEYVSRLGVLSQELESAKRRLALRKTQAATSAPTPASELTAPL